MKKYKKPAIHEEHIKVNFFLSPTSFLDDFNLMGDVYAQSTAATSQPTNNGCTNSGTSTGGGTSGSGGSGTGGGSSGSAGTSSGSQP